MPTWITGTFLVIAGGVIAVVVIVVWFGRSWNSWHQPKN